MYVKENNMISSSLKRPFLLLGKLEHGAKRIAHQRQYHAHSSRFKYKYCGRHCRGNNFRRLSTTNQTTLASTTSSEIEVVWRERAEKLLAIPIGSLKFSRIKWHEYRMAIVWWLDNNYDASVPLSLKLLKRLVQEEEIMVSVLDKECGADTAGEQSAPEYYNTDFLNLMVNRWRKEIAAGDSSKQAKSQISPSEMVQFLFELHGNTQTKLKPDVRTFSMIIDASSYFTDPSEGVFMADRILQWMIDELNNNLLENAHLRPNVFTFSSVMNVWVKSSQPVASKRVEELLEVMKKLNKTHPEWEVAPSCVTYATVIDVWAKRGNVLRVEELLQEMYEDFLNCGREAIMRPNLTCLNGYLVALAKRGDIDRAEEVLEQMHALYEAAELSSKPSVVSYSTVLDSAAKSGSRRGAERAYKILRMMENDGIKPNVISYNSVLNAFARQGMVKMCERVLEEMYQAYEAGNELLRPTSYSYSIVLAAWAKSRAKQAGIQAEKILKLMKMLANSGELEKVDRVTYNTVLDCWAKSGSNSAPARTLAILDEMRNNGVKADTLTYNIVFNIFARNRKMHRVQSIWNKMKQDNVPADTTTYNTLIFGWSRQREKGSIQRAESIFGAMKTDPNVKPDVYTLNSMLLCYSQIGNGQAAESLLADMILGKVGVTRRSFNITLAALSKDGSPAAAERAEMIFSKMKALGGELSPDLVTYSTILNGWAVSRNPNAAFRAERVFKELVQKPMIQPNARCYAALTTVWSKASHPDAARRADEYLRKVILMNASGDNSYRPNTDLFRQVIEAWGDSDDLVEAAERADSLLASLLDQIHAGNHFARADIQLFAVALDIISKASVDDKAARADKVISMMKRAKLMPDRYILRLLMSCYKERTNMVQKSA